ncbi:hypothetical protein [Stenotrophomonas maltophilia]|uniref:hypothetical protein n=1 Tax=Stenotrophomonas maltophilia TaxID=40324 RepID=UPI0013112145|nr:hypothetical protein [Stenotrophomonas maltophilia]
MSGNATPRPSLLKHFEAPADHTGEFGWICGFSADASFLNEAAYRFTGQNKSQREAIGEVRLALMLDPRQPALLPTAVPGLAHLPLRNESRSPIPFRLLHAKVALLGFRHQSEPEKWCVRLVVSTGNWTRQTVEDSLDLSCQVEVDSATLGDALSQECVDIIAARDWLKWLVGLHDTRLLEAPAPMGAGAAAANLAAWLAVCSRYQPALRERRARFVHNRSRSLLDGVLNAVERHDKPKATRLAMGSGFFESPGLPGKSGAPPCASVPLQIVKKLKARGLLDKRAALELHVNPTACQAIAHSIAELARHPEHAIHVHAAKVADVIGDAYRGRALHAKFMAAARAERNGSNWAHVWVYLGSGNLTPAGMMLPMSPEGGNAEAGMLLFETKASWGAGARAKLALDLQDALPIAGDLLVPGAPEVSAGEAWQPPASEYYAAPVAFLQWRAADGLLLLPHQDGDLDTPFEVLDDACVPCRRVDGGFAWPGGVPRTVRVRWAGSGVVREAVIPVVDADGRVAATPLSDLDLDHAESQLLAFPGMPDPEGDEEEEGLGDPLLRDPMTNGRSACPVSDAAVGDETAIRQMMGLLERIADRQVRVPVTDWPRWCQRLQQTLCQTRHSPAVAKFVALGLDPLSPLHAEPFRPAFAEDMHSEHGQRYEAALQVISDTWGTTGLASLEGLE